MQQINIVLWCNDSDNWSIEINGLRHDHVSTEVKEDLIEVAVIMAEDSLTEAARRLPQ